MKRKLVTTAMAMTVALALAACGGAGDDQAGSDATSAASDQGATIKFWLVGPDTNAELRQYLVDTFAAQNPGSKLVIEEQSWSDVVPELTMMLPDPNNTPDVVEIGNTQTPTFSYANAFREIAPEFFAELGGDDLLKSFVAAGDVDGKHYAVPYYFGSRYMFYRKDIWTKAGLQVPTTLAEFEASVTTLQAEGRSGFAMGGQDWRDGISWVFANGGNLATVEGTTWTSTLSDPNTIKGLQQWQAVYSNASHLLPTDNDLGYATLLNDGEGGAEPAAATVMAPGWNRWSIGDLVTNAAGVEARDGMADDSRFDIFALPGVDGGVAPVFAGGSNVAISATTQHPKLAENLLRIIFSPEYQEMLGGAGLGPGNQQYVTSLGTDKFATTAIETAQASRLTPAAPGWAAIESALVYEELFQKIAEGGDVTALAAEFDSRLTPMLNGK